MEPIESRQPCHTRLLRIISGSHGHISENMIHNLFGHLALHHSPFLHNTVRFTRFEIAPRVTVCTVTVTLAHPAAMA